MWVIFLQGVEAEDQITITTINTMTEEEEVGVRAEELSDLGLDLLHNVGGGQDRDLMKGEDGIQMILLIRLNYWKLQGKMRRN